MCLRKRGTKRSRLAGVHERNDHKIQRLTRKISELNRNKFRYGEKDDDARVEECKGKLVRKEKFSATNSDKMWHLERGRTFEKVFLGSQDGNTVATAFCSAPHSNDRSFLPTGNQKVSSINNFDQKKMFPTGSIAHVVPESSE